MGLVVLSAISAATASAQVTPAAGITPPDDTPSIRVGLTLFPTFVFQTNPEITDADGNVVNKNAFDVARSYINITGNISHLVAFRITPDITRESGLLTLGTGNSVSSDSLVFRIKYAYAQFNLDDWMTRGSWARIGIQQTPWVDFEEGIYRYRFQGTVFAERIPLPTTMTSSDAGVSFHYNLPSNYGDVHVGVYNGENYQKVEVNNQKASRVSRHAPAVRDEACRCCEAFGRISSTTTTTTPASDERKRVMGNVTFEHQYLNAGFDYLQRQGPDAGDGPRRFESGLLGLGDAASCRRPMARRGKALLRYDHLTPNTSTTAGAGIDVASSGRHGAERSEAEPDDRRRRLLVPAPGQRQHRDAPRLRRPELRQHHDRARPKDVAVHGLVNF